MTRSSTSCAEAERDQLESGFTRILRRLWQCHDALLAVVFVDRIGECVDYCCSIDPFEAKILGAHLQVVADNVREPIARMGAGQLVSLHVAGEDHDLLLRRVGAGYTLVVLVRAGAESPALHYVVAHTVDELRAEAGIDVESWDPDAGPLEVTTRDAAGWDYAPATVGLGAGRVEIDDVLGRWEEPGGLVGGRLHCFRVRVVDGGEMTLAHDISQDRWRLWGVAPWDAEQFPE